MSMVDKFFSDVVEKEPTSELLVRLDKSKDQRKRLDVICSALHITKTEFVQRAIEMALQMNEEKLNLPIDKQ